MRKHLVRPAIGLGLVAAALVTGLAAAAPASAATTSAAASVRYGMSAIPASSRVYVAWFPTYYACQYEGNVLAQQGRIQWFTCAPASGSGWILTGGSY